LFFWK